MIKSVLFYAALLLPALSSAQNTSFRYGLSFPAGAQFGLIRQTGAYYSPVGTAGILATARTDGASERSFCWQQHLGVAYNVISYKVESGDFLHAELYNFLIEPEVLLPTRNDRIHISVGIGVYYTFSVDAVSHSNSQSAGNFYSNIDSFGTVLEVNSRSLLPFISAGMVYRFSSRYQAGCKVRQMLRNSFEPDAATICYVNREPVSIPLSFQPTFLEVSLTYFLRNKNDQ